MVTGDAAGSSGSDAEQAPGRLRESELSHILSAISHEIKNPLASLKLNAQMLTRAIERGRQPRIESAHLLSQAVDQLDHIASELSDAVRAESGRFELTLKPVDVAALARRVAADAEAAYQRTIALEVPATPLVVQADEARLRLAMAYLLANAAKYTPNDRGITLTARLVGPRVRVEARDQGVGIGEHDLPYIFDAFYQGAATPQPEAPEGAGLGLGLYIARCIIRRHGGEVGAESAPGQGATVWIALPLAKRN